MKPTATQLLKGGVVGCLLLAWMVAAHVGSAGRGNADFNAAVGLAPLVAAAVLVVWRQCRLWLVALLLTALFGGLAWSWPQWRQNVAALYYLQHLGAHLALAALFGRTLFGPQEALVTAMARHIYNGQISERKVRYTRGVTWAWTGFFCLNAAVSTGLFWLAPHEVWSVHANFMTGPLVALMFVGEHLWRMWALPPHERPSMWTVIRAYRAGAGTPARPGNTPPAATP